jgi:hypothetical protein
MTLRLRAEELDWQELDSEIVVLDGRTAAYLSVNGSGAMLWRLLARDATREQLVHALLDTYDVEQARAEADTDAFLSTLSARGLVVAA